MSRLLLVCACWLSLVGALGANQGGRRGASGDTPRVTATLSAGVARLGEEIVLQVEVEGAQSARITGLPEVEDLTIRGPGRPSEMNRTYSINGRVYRSRTRTWSMLLQPAREGAFDIPPVELMVDGKPARTRALSLKVVEDLRGADLGFLEVRTVPEQVFEGQPFTVELVLGWDQGTRVNYVNLSLPWWGELPGALEAEQQRTIPDPVGGLVVNGTENLEGEELDPRRRNGRSFRTLRVLRTFVPTRTGALEFPSSFLEFGQLERQRSFFSSGQRKASSFFVRSDAFSLEVKPLPEEGRPFDFSGAIGAIQARASVDARDVVVGDSIKLSVEWSGEGNMEFFEPPDLSRLDAFSAGFRVYGRTEEKSFERRKVTYDLAPLSDDVKAIPPVPLSTFDPVSSRYEVVESSPIPLRVRPLARATVLDDGAEADAGFEEDIEDIDARPLEQRARESGSGASLDRAVPLTAALVLVGWVVLRTLVRRSGLPDAAAARLRRRARKRLRTALGGARTPEERWRAFAAFLAAHSQENEEAWLGRDVEAWANERRAGLESDATNGSSQREDHGEVERLQRALNGLEAAVYGQASEPSSEELLQVAESVAEGFGRGGPRS